MDKHFNNDNDNKNNSVMTMDKERGKKTLHFNSGF